MQQRPGCTELVIITGVGTVGQIVLAAPEKFELNVVGAQNAVLVGATIG